MDSIHELTKILNSRIEKNIPQLFVGGFLIHSLDMLQYINDRI